jgi:hypothetical protein
MTKREAKIEALYIASSMLKSHSEDNLGIEEPTQTKVQDELLELSKQLEKRIQRLLTS